MTETNPNDSSDPPFEFDEPSQENLEGTVRERILEILPSVDEPTKVSEFADLAVCSKQGARNILREFEKEGVVILTSEEPEKYKKNPQYYQFLRGHNLAQELSKTELEKKLVGLIEKHKEFQKKFNANSPDDVEIGEIQSQWRHEELIKWQGIINKIDDVREAYKQTTDYYPPKIEQLTQEEATNHLIANFGRVDSINDESHSNIEPLHTTVHQQAKKIAQIQDDLSNLEELMEEMIQDDNQSTD
jgi:hypothetical protein